MKSNLRLLFMTLMAFLCTTTAAFAQVSGTFCQVPLVPISNIQVNCEQLTITGTSVNRTRISFLVDATGEAGKIEITQFTPDTFKMESFLDGNLMVSATYTKPNVNFSFSPAFMQRTDNDIGIQALSTALAHKEVIAPTFGCLSRPPILAGFCETGCKIAGAVAKAGCWGAGAAVCAGTAGAGCVAAVIGSSLCDSLVGEIVAGCINDCNASVSNCNTVCFLSPQSLSLNLTPLPPGVTVIIGGVNLNAPTNNLTAISLALQGGSSPLQQLNSQFVAAQLSFIKVRGHSAPGASSARDSPLKCYVFNTTVTLSNGVTITPNSTLNDLFMQTEIAIRENRTADMLVLAKLFDMLNTLNRCR